MTKICVEYFNDEGDRHWFYFKKRKGVVFKIFEWSLKKLVKIHAIEELKTDQKIKEQFKNFSKVQILRNDPIYLIYERCTKRF